MKTKNLRNAYNYSNDSKDILFDGTVNLNIGGNKFASKDIDDVYSGVDYSVENAIQDLISIATSQYGEIKILTTKTDPGGYAQVDKWEFIDTSNLKYENDTYINILGKMVLMKKGYDIENLVLETKSVIFSYIDEGVYFSRLKEIDNTSFEVEYLDRRDHDPIVSPDEHRFSLQKTIVREPIYGYGKWSFIGSKTEKLETGDVKLYYYQRVD